MLFDELDTQHGNETPDALYKEAPNKKNDLVKFHKSNYAPIIIPYETWSKFTSQIMRL